MFVCHDSIPRARAACKPRVNDVYTCGKRKEILVDPSCIHGGISVRPGGDSRELAAYLSPVGFSSRSEARSYRPVPANERSGRPGRRSPDPFDFSSSLPTFFSGSLYWLRRLLSGNCIIHTSRNEILRTSSGYSRIQCTNLRTNRLVPNPTYPTHPSSGQPISRVSIYTCAHNTYTNVFTRANTWMERQRKRGRKESYHHSSNAHRLYSLDTSQALAISRHIFSMTSRLW